MLTIPCIIFRSRISCNFLHYDFMHYSQYYSQDHYQNNLMVNDTLLQCMTILLEYYNENHKFNNLLTVLLKYLNLFSTTF